MSRESLKRFKEEKESVVTHAKTRKTLRILAKRVPPIFLHFCPIRETLGNFPVQLEKTIDQTCLLPVALLTELQDDGAGQIKMLFLHRDKIKGDREKNSNFCMKNEQDREKNGEHLSYINIYTKNPLKLQLYHYNYIHM